MHLLGLDIAAERIVGVIVDGAGSVMRRGARVGRAAEAADLARELSAGMTLEAVGAAIDGETGPDALLRALPGQTSAVACTPGAAAVTAEGWTGAAQGARHAVCLEVGDRVFAGIVLDGRLWNGSHGLAGSAAWLSLNPVERQDYRKYGSLAAEVSSEGIARRLSWRIQAGDDSGVLARAGDLESITAAHVYEGARAGDGVSISVLRDTARYIGMALANLAVCLDPEVVVLGGGAAAAADLLLEPVQQEFARRLPPGMAGRVRLAVSPLGDEGVAIGAARLAVQARA